MTNQSPLPRAESAPVQREDRNGVPYAQYVRRLDLLDANPPTSEDAPIHVARRIMFDGVITPANIATDSLITIDVSTSAATIVTMHVLADDVQIGYLDEETDTYVPHLIGGRHVMTPVGQGWQWTPVDEDRPDWIVCSFYVAEVHVA